MVLPISAPTDDAALAGPMIACTNLSAVMAFDVQAPIADLDNECRPFTQDAAGGHSYHFTIPFPPGFTEFYLQRLGRARRPGRGLVPLVGRLHSGPLITIPGRAGASPARSPRA